jgi:hypothetical protein
MPSVRCRSWPAGCSTSHRKKHCRTRCECALLAHTSCSKRSMGRMCRLRSVGSRWSGSGTSLAGLCRNHRMKRCTTRYACVSARRKKETNRSMGRTSRLHSVGSRWSDSLTLPAGWCTNHRMKRCTTACACVFEHRKKATKRSMGRTSRLRSVDSRWSGSATLLAGWCKSHRRRRRMTVRACAFEHRKMATKRSMGRTWQRVQQSSG